MLVMVRGNVHEDDERFLGYQIVDSDADVVWIDVPPEEIKADFTVSTTTEPVEFWGQRSMHTVREMDVRGMTVAGCNVLNREEVCLALMEM